ncbi:DUF6443 domain-containing protein [Sinomicrobium kalidii]|uniref:DUF6443 domain-containing protein n=1 Tax=Sinomicrobium kalidii TaxID=2900738 RepID=UPI001E4B4378|nr:DUF6443 domain-containing protein [Sinomicrobium kalidii]UGU17926.1 DUF6443 domain-containing protein [Sinomicrobium kalidii]
MVYYDGLGRPKQEIAIKASDGKQDLITHIEYDEFGRQDKEYLPYRAGQNKGQFNGSALSQTNSFYNTTKYENTTNPYSEKVFEPSPLNRVEEVGAPGTPWKASPNSDNDHTIKYRYTTNGDSGVRLYQVSLTSDYTPSLEASGLYEANQLYATVTKDENWQPGDGHLHTTWEFKDKQDRVILKRTYATVNGAVKNHDTYYVYDDYGNLTYVLPPKVNTSDGVSTAELNELCYQYRYDARNRLIEKKLPGKGKEYIVYNKLDQPVMTQDTKLKNQNKWLFTKYDAFGRVAYTGVKHHAGDREAFQNSANNTTSFKQYETKTTTANTYAGTSVYYTKDAIPKTMDEIHTINYYDNYTFNKAGLTVPTTVLGQTVDTRTKTLATGSKTRVLGTNHWITTINAYDKKGRLIYTATKNPYLNTTDIVESKLDFAGKVLETKTTHTKGNNPAIVTVDKFEYDHMGRLLTQTQKVNNQAEELIAENTYDDLGQLEQKKVGNTRSKPLQTIDYAYNVRGWLKAINDADNLGNSLFGFQVNYNTSRSGAVPALYNGNIAETYWKTANDNTLRRYAYTYDALNRITSGLYNGGGHTNRYTLKDIAYDKNGNITQLTRNGAINTNASSFGEMDRLSYAYYNGGNFLVKVSDAANKTYGFKDGSNTDNDYGRDANGNTTRDRNKGITSIAYNHLNLPTRISFGTNKIDYIYDASGIKLEKAVTRGSSVTTTEYAGNYIYENSQLKQVSHPEGYFEPKAGGSYQYVYYLKDHQNNVRITFADDNGDGVVGTSETRREQNYYPFGLEHRGYNGETYGVKSNLKTFQDQEFTEDLGLNVHEWKYRISDPAIGRFWQIDPLAEDYVHNGVYNFSENRVIDGIELEGLEWKSVKDDNGNTNLTLTVQLYNDAGLKDKQLTKVKESIREQFAESYSNSDENITASLVIEDAKEAKGDFLVTLTEQTSSPVYDDEGNKTGITYKGGKTGELGKTQKNNFEVTAKRDGSKRSNSDISRSFSHEAGHTAGLRHPWSSKQKVDDIKQGAEGVKASTVRKNLMNSGANKIKANRSTSGTQLTKGQLKSADELVRNQQN